jgi:hypothetical protein
MHAAGFALMRFEAALDRLIGRPLRLAVGRYTGVVFLGAPIDIIRSARPARGKSPK